MTKLLIIGAGPYALAAAAYARHLGVGFRLLGEPMGFWKRHMPPGMRLRSPASWHMDPLEIHTLERFIEERGLRPEEAEPVPLALFLEYAEWFQERSGVEAEPEQVRELKQCDAGFAAELESGEISRAENVLVAPGFRPFANIPAVVAQSLPADRYSHTCELVDFAGLTDQRCLILGGRQSAFEWAALISEQAGAPIDLVCRHPTPEFAPSDWSWVGGMLAATAQEHGWFRHLPPGEQEAIQQRFWSEGRRKLEPWLLPRITRPNIRLRPQTQVLSCAETGSGEVRVELDHGGALLVDRVILATGYEVAIDRAPYLASSLLEALEVADGYPILDECLQSNIPGLFFTGITAVRQFGPFFGFVAAAPAAARLTMSALAGSD